MRGHVNAAGASVTVDSRAEATVASHAEVVSEALEECDRLICIGSAAVGGAWAYAALVVDTFASAEVIAVLWSDIRMQKPGCRAACYHRALWLRPLCVVTVWTLTRGANSVTFRRLGQPDPAMWGMIMLPTDKGHCWR